MDKSRLNREQEYLSNYLLNRDSLMTPVLTSQFGELYAVQSATIETEEIYTRISSVYQKLNASRLLDAELKIIISALPKSIFSSLRNTRALFGQILLNHGIDAKVENRVLFKKIDKDNGEVRYGRRHSLVETQTGTTLCHVEELLVPEVNLLLARSHFKEGYVDD